MYWCHIVGHKYVQFLCQLKLRQVDHKFKVSLGYIAKP
jgi:hypothetical protein